MLLDSLSIPIFKIPGIVNSSSAHEHPYYGVVMTLCDTVTVNEAAKALGWVRWLEGRHRDWRRAKYSQQDNDACLEYGCITIIL
jgi:hypothetical protein